MHCAWYGVVLWSSHWLIYSYTYRLHNISENLQHKDMLLNVNYQLRKFYVDIFSIGILRFLPHLPVIQ